MQLSHSEPDAPHCFTANDHRLICPEGGAAIYSASDAQVQHTPATMELDPSCYGANATAQCVAKTPAQVAPTVAEDNSTAPQ
jgi:hypothetical protein